MVLWSPGEEEEQGEGQVARSEPPHQLRLFVVQGQQPPVELCNLRLQLVLEQLRLQRRPLRCDRLQSGSHSRLFLRAELTAGQPPQQLGLPRRGCGGA